MFTSRYTIRGKGKTVCRTGYAIRADTIQYNWSTRQQEKKEGLAKVIKYFQYTYMLTSVVKKGFYIFPKGPENSPSSEKKSLCRKQPFCIYHFTAATFSHFLSVNSMKIIGITIVFGPLGHIWCGLESIATARLSNLDGGALQSKYFWLFCHAPKSHAGESWRYH